MKFKLSSPLRTLKVMGPALLAGAIACLPIAAHAKPLHMTITTGTPVIQADARQTAYIKIAVTSPAIEQADTERPTVNVALVLDRSGSMAGTKLERAKQAAKAAVSQLGPRDIVSVISYDHRVTVEVPATRASDVASIHAAIDQMRPDGNTALFAGVSKGAKELRKFLDSKQVNRIILLSDGIANSGPSTPAELGALGQGLAKEGMTVSTLGLGLNYNEDLMVQLANSSDGNHMFVENATDLAQVFAKEFDSLFSVVAKDVHFEVKVDSGVRPLRVLNREAEISGNIVKFKLPQVYSEQEKYVMLEVEVPAGKPNSRRQLAKVKMDYNDVIAQRQRSARGALKVSYSDSQREIAANYNKDTLQEAAIQEANIISKQALQYRDAGLKAKARGELESASGKLQDFSTTYGLDAAEIEEAKETYETQAAEVEDDYKWQRNRKDLKAQQYKTEKRQK